MAGAACAGAEIDAAGHSGGSSSGAAGVSLERWAEISNACSVRVVAMESGLSKESLR